MERMLRAEQRKYSEFGDNTWNIVLPSGKPIRLPNAVEDWAKPNPPLLLPGGKVLLSNVKIEFWAIPFPIANRTRLT